MSAATSSHENRLARETSPYLLQHKHNPVEWWPWGPEALAEAKRANKPILLSVGYAACHWCHVMAHESFENEATAQVMNELFVNIKVDREERPDIDQIYMNALHSLGEQGGWPLTMFLTPDGEPVWGGTYFPPESRYGRPAFMDVLREFARVFREEPDKIANSRNAIMGKLKETNSSGRKVNIGPDELDQAAAALARMMDPVNGGLRGAPKFPQALMLENLWRAGLRRNDQRFFDIVERTLNRISEGGIYDHLGGGYARYSVDDKWLVPHFEKMLYDNAQLMELLALVWARSGDELFRTRAKETVGWLAREMTTADGAFSASLDADSEGEEGKFYVWSLAEIEKILGAEDAAFFASHYDISEGGNFEGHNIPNRLNDRTRSRDEEARLAALRQRLLTERDKRVRPGLDDKVLADWNGLMIAALVNAGTLFGEPAWISQAQRAFDAIAANMTKNGRLGHSWRESKVLYPGLASDYAAMIRAALALYEATAEQRFLDKALEWQKSLDAHYYNDETKRYYLTADDAEGLVIRPHSTIDEAIPNPNALIAQNLVRLAVLSGNDAWRMKFDLMMDGLLPLAAENLFVHVSPLNALDLRLRGAEIVVTGDGPAADDLASAARRLPFIDRIVLRVTDAERLPTGHPARDKIAASGGQAAAFVCVGERCSLPVNQASALEEAVSAMRRPAA
jgi:uncharacterized protein YyaL (SSP411 family)